MGVLSPEENALVSSYYNYVLKKCQTFLPGFFQFYDLSYEFPDFIQEFFKLPAVYLEFHFILHVKAADS